MPQQNEMRYTDRGHGDLNLERFIAGIDQGESGYLCRLSSRQEHPRKKNSFIQSFLGEWENEVPGYNDIARQYGGGDYRMQVYFEANGEQKVKTHDFHIDERFKSAQTPPPAQHPQSPAISGNGRDRGFEMMQLMLQQQNKTTEVIFTLLGTMITALTSRNNDNMQPFFEGFQNMMIESARSQMDLMQEYGKRIYQIPDQDDSDEDQDAASVQGIVSMLINFWHKYGKTLFDASKNEQKFFAKQIQKTDEYKQLMADPQLFGQAYTALIQEAPKDKVDQLLKILGIDIQAQEQQQQQQTQDEV